VAGGTRRNQTNSDDERSALDIARVEKIQAYGDPARILPALIPVRAGDANNYIASLRLAEMQFGRKALRRGDRACDRGLSRGPGASGRACCCR